MNVAAGTESVEALKLSNVVEQSGAFAPVAPILTVMEKSLTNFCMVHEFFPLRKQPEVAPGRMLARKVLMAFYAKLADVKN